MSGTAIRLSALGFHGISSIWTVCVGLRERSLTVREVRNLKQDFSEKIRIEFWKQLAPKGIVESDGRNIRPPSRLSQSTSLELRPGGQPSLLRAIRAAHQMREQTI